MRRLDDTDPETFRRRIEAYRHMACTRKWQNLGDDWVTARVLHVAGFRRRNPEATLAEIRADWLAQSCDEKLDLTFPDSKMAPIHFAPVLRFALRVFDNLGIGYAIGGSIASSMHGIGRMTRDADVVVEPFPGREAAFVASFTPVEFYLSADAVAKAVRERFSFNILHPESGFKIDVYVLKDDPFDQSAFARRESMILLDQPSQPVMCYSPEDIILQKLRWYRLGEEISEQQIDDVLGVLRTQADRLDHAYLKQWAATLGLTDLLNRVLGEV